jgi:hypothetical protein
VTGGPVEAFLAEFERHLGRDRETRERVLSEVGDHLRDLARENRARGLEELAAEADAVELFCPPRPLSRGLRPAPRRSRRALAALIPVIAIACGALALAELRPAGQPASVALAQGGHATAATAEAAGGCRFTYTPPAGQRQGLILVATQVRIDPHTGRILGCHPLGGLGAVLQRRARDAIGNVFARDGRYAPGATMKPVLVVAAGSPFG